MIRLIRWVTSLFRRRPPYRPPGCIWSDLDAEKIAVHMANAANQSALR